MRNYTEKKYDYKSILVIDIFALLILIAMFFLWYAEILNVYTKIKFKETLKEYIDAKIRFYLNQNSKIVTIEQGGKTDGNNDYEDIREKNLEYEGNMSNKPQFTDGKKSEDIKIENSLKEENDISHSLNKKNQI